MARSAVRRDIPSRERLMARMSWINRLSVPFLLAEAAGIVLLLAVLDWPQLARNKLIASIAVGVATAHALLSLAQMIVQRKTPVEEIAESARLGNFSKGELLAIVEGTLRRLGLGGRGVPIYLVRDKDLNACAIHVALAPFRALKAVYLNRAVLHLLKPEELKSVLGHELGHNFRYDLLWSRYLMLHLAFGAVLSLFIVQHFGAGSEVGIFVVLFVMGGWEWLIALPRRRVGQDVEFLCDDLGACLAGPTTAIREMLVTGLECEAREQLLREALVMRAKGREVRVQDAIAAYEQAMPWGRVSAETVKQLEEALKEQRRKDAGLSLRGFLAHIRNDEASAEQAEDIVKILEVLRRAPCLDRTWLSGFDVRFGTTEIAELMAELEAHPDHLLFRSMGELDGVSTHPSWRRRILYVWRHRDAIAADSARLAA